MAAKRLNTDRTVLTELKLQLVDANVRNRLVTQSMASKVTSDSDLRTGDATITQTKTLILDNITSVVYIQSYGPFYLRLANSLGVIQEVPCAGLFLFYGQVDSVEIRAVQNENLRVSYICA